MLEIIPKKLHKRGPTFFYHQPSHQSIELHDSITFICAKKFIIGQQGYRA